MISVLFGHYLCWERGIERLTSMTITPVAWYSETWVGGATRGSEIQPLPRRCISEVKSVATHPVAPLILIPLSKENCRVFRISDYFLKLKFFLIPPLRETARNISSLLIRTIPVAGGRIAVGWSPANLPMPATIFCKLGQTFPVMWTDVFWFG